MKAGLHTRVPSLNASDRIGGEKKQQAIPFKTKWIHVSENLPLMTGRNETAG